MFGWVIGIILGFAAVAAVAVLLRMEKLLHAWFRGEITGLREDVNQARIELRTLSSLQTNDMLDHVEGEDVEIAGNLDRMNALLDQLNALIKGKAVGNFEMRRRRGFEDAPVIFSGQLDFTSPEELLRFAALPPISEEEIRAMDWESFFKSLS